jgi:DNA-binding MarR family transcriptional regulator
MKKHNRYAVSHKEPKKGIEEPNLTEKVRLYQYKMLLLIKNGHYAGSIGRQMNISRTTTQDRIKRLLALGLIKVDVKTSATFYVLTKKGYESIKEFDSRLSRHPRQTGKTRLHRLCLKFNIVKDEGKMVFDKEYELNNWVQKFIKIKFPVGITIRKTPKSIIAMFHEFESDKGRCLNDFFNHIIRGSYYVYYYCAKNGLELDLFSLEVIDQHIVNEAPELAGKIDDSKTTTLDLQRQAKSYFKTNFRAKAWIDHSKGLPEIETNDFLYEERLLSMPEAVYNLQQNMIPILSGLAKEINLHLVVMQDMRDSMHEMRDTMKEIRDNVKRKE